MHMHTYVALSGVHVVLMLCGAATQGTAKLGC